MGLPDPEGKKDKAVPPGSAPQASLEAFHSLPYILQGPPTPTLHVVISIRHRLFAQRGPLRCRWGVKSNYGW